VLFLSSFSAFHIVSGALNHGAAGFIGKKEEDFAALPTAVRSVYGGSVYLPASLASVVLSNVFKPDVKVRGNLQEALSPRELEVVRLLFDGSTIMEIADRLSRSPKTISNQKNSAMKKLAAKNDVELAKVVRDLGIFQ
jgi:two-component system capsular synthesis response regulator RcsB